MPTTTPAPRSGWEPVIDGAKLREARLAKELTQRELIRECARLGTDINPGNFQRAEAGKPGGIGIRKLRTVAAVLGIGDVNEVLTPYGRELATRRAA